MCGEGVHTLTPMQVWAGTAARHLQAWLIALLGICHDHACKRACSVARVCTHRLRLLSVFCQTSLPSVVTASYLQGRRKRRSRTARDDRALEA